MTHLCNEVWFPSIIFIANIHLKSSIRIVTSSYKTGTDDKLQVGRIKANLNVDQETADFHKIFDMNDADNNFKEIFGTILNKNVRERKKLNQEINVDHMGMLNRILNIANKQPMEVNFNETFKYNNKFKNSHYTNEEVKKEEGKTDIKIEEVFNCFNNNNNCSKETIKNVPEDNVWDIVDVCKTRKCPKYKMSICAVTKVWGKKYYRHFLNDCFYSMANYCNDVIWQGYLIVLSESCLQYRRKNRRHNFPSNAFPIQKPKTFFRSGDLHQDEATTNAQTTVGTAITEDPKEAALLSQQFEAPSTASTMYPRSNLTCSHLCPVVCSELYAPVCIAIDRMNGLKTKYFSFVNHCCADKWVCENIGGDQLSDRSTLHSFPLEQTTCGSNRYIQFHRTSQFMSSLNHYGWLLGEEPFNAIV